jgi:hypothetical protein
MKYVHGIFKGDKDKKYKEDNGKIVIIIITAFLEKRLCGGDRSTI